ncbi:MAG: glutamate--cysteine ligase [Oligoflexales bacterium]
MGVDISKLHFSKSDVSLFNEKIRDETKLINDWFCKKQFSNKVGTGGFELESWLVDSRCRPVPANVEFIEELDDPMIVPELAKYNFELNSKPFSIKGDGLLHLKKDLRNKWKKAEEQAKKMNLRLMMIGILPTIQEGQLNMENISPSNRYYALNERLMNMRKKVPIQLDIKGKDHLKLEHNDVILEAAATSLQIHLQIDQDQGTSFYNASKVASAPLVAISANSPFLFGKELWEESRIPLFEQSISLAEKDYAERVTFGIRYLDRSLMEYFDANRQRYLPILPLIYKDQSPEKLKHLCLHNGTIWRWNRVIIGPPTQSNPPNLRIEQRVAPAGPSLEDSIANSAFYYGLVCYLAKNYRESQELINFYQARDNFYEAARYGLAADIVWHNDQVIILEKLIKDSLLDMAKEGLSILEVADEVSKHYLSVIEERLLSGQTGAAWQRQYKAKHKCSFEELSCAYYDLQQTELPVHQWPLTARH